MRFIKKLFLSRSLSRGDTLIEVLFATATAALVIVISLSLMNRSLAQVQMSVETTFVRQAMDSQAEVLRYVRDQYAADPGSDTGMPKLWKDIVSSSATGHSQSEATDFGTCQPGGGGQADTDAGGKGFYLKNISTGVSSTDAENDSVDIKNITLAGGADSLKPSQTYAQPGQGLWIEAVHPTPDFTPTQTVRYVDLHIRGCWEPPFAGPTATIGTIVRLYYELPKPPPPVGPATKFVSATPNPIASGGSSTISWTTDPTATSCTATNFPGAVHPPGGTFSTGSLTASKTYSIQCFKDAIAGNTATITIDLAAACALPGSAIQIEEPADGSAFYSPNIIAPIRICFPPDKRDDFQIKDVSPMGTVRIEDYTGSAINPVTGIYETSLQLDGLGDYTIQIKQGEASSSVVTIRFQNTTD